MIILFARNKSAESQLQEQVPAGTKFITLSGANQKFSIGDDIFIATQEGTQIEYLGQALNVNTSGIATPFVVNQDYPPGSLLWKSQTCFRLNTGEELPVHHRLNTGLEIQRSLGGVLYSVRVREPFRTAILQIPNISSKTYDELERWIISKLDYGLQEFTYVDHQRAVASVRLLNAELNYQENKPGYAVLTLELALCALPGYT